MRKLIPIAVGVLVFLGISYLFVLAAVVMYFWTDKHGGYGENVAMASVGLPIAAGVAWVTYRAFTWLIPKTTSPVVLWLIGIFVAVFYSLFAYSLYRVWLA